MLVFDCVELLENRNLLDHLLHLQVLTVKPSPEAQNSLTFLERFSLHLAKFFIGFEAFELRLFHLLVLESGEFFQFKDLVLERLDDLRVFSTQAVRLVAHRVVLFSDLHREIPPLLHLSLQLFLITLPYRIIDNSGSRGALGSRSYCIAVVCRLRRLCTTLNFRVKRRFASGLIAA